MVVAAAVLQ